jgi:hypothetical protein
MTVSGAVVYSSGNTLRQTAKGSSGQLLIAQGTNSPQWKNPITTLVWYIEGALSVNSTGSAVVSMPYGFTVQTGSLRINAAPTGQAVIVDIKKDGASIYSTKPQIAAGSKKSNQTGILSVTSFAESSEVHVSVDQVGSTLAGSGLTIMLKGTRKY